MDIAKENDPIMRVQRIELRKVAELSWNAASELIFREGPESDGESMRPTAIDNQIN